MDDEHIRRFAKRSWAILSHLDRDHWTKEYARQGSSVTLAAARALWQHMRQVRPNWPNASERREDLAHHVILKEKLARTASIYAAR
ncbi:MAG: hypothetical protein H6714_05060 [Myxococcales bacterium]|nr:hypothetical protein [Myxococcales bacterium]